MATSFTLKVKDYNDDGRIVTIAQKEVYNLDGNQSASDWVREPIKELDTIKGVQVSNAIEVNENKAFGSILKTGHIGYFYNNSNRVSQNPTNVALFSEAFADGHGLPIGPTNFNRCIALFTARRLIEPEFYNTCDEYMVPNESHQKYQQFVNDCTVFSLFHSASLQSSLRKIQYKNKEWDIYNHFFFMSVKEMQALAVKHNFNDLYNDTIGKSNSYVYNLLNTITLSDDAKKVLDLAKQLIIKSFNLRQAAHEVKPEMHLNAFDAGWYQIRNGILKDSFPDDYKVFTDTFKTFSARLRPQVYELGFLKP